MKTASASPSAPAPTASLQAEPGQELHLGLGRTYRLLKPLAPRASTGAVWSAQWLQAQSQVALKWLPPDVEPPVRLLQRRALEREATALASCQHPHLVRLYTVGHLQDCEPVLVLEQLHEPLQQHLLQYGGTAAGLPLAKALSLAHQLALALLALHRSGFRHLDVKPANLLLTPPGPLGQRLKLADLGACTPLAIALHSFQGTPGWMAPEQCQPRPDAAPGSTPGRFCTDARADVFAVGQVLFYLLTGQGSAWARQSHAAAQSGALVGLQPAQTTGCALNHAELQQLDALWRGTPGNAACTAAPAAAALPTWLAELPAVPTQQPHAAAVALAAPPAASSPLAAASPLRQLLHSLCALLPAARCSDMQATADALQSTRLAWMQAQRSACSANGAISSNEGTAGAPGFFQPRNRQP